MAMKDSLTIEEIVRYEGLCAVGFTCEDCPGRERCRKVGELLEW